MDNQSYELSEIVMAEKMKEKFDITVNDELIGLNIYAAQKKFEDYRLKYDTLIDDESPYGFDSNIASQLGKTLMKFSTDNYKNDRLMLTERIVKKMKKVMIPYEEELFHNIVYVYTESQQWSDVADLLRDQTMPELCNPSIKTVSYLKNNLVYCFQNNVR